MADQPSAADILAGNGDDWTKLRDYVGQTITVTGFEVHKGVHGDFPVLEVLTSEGDEAHVMAGKFLISKLTKLEAAGFFPIDVEVEQFPTDKGNDGFGLKVAE